MLDVGTYVIYPYESSGNSKEFFIIKILRQPLIKNSVPILEYKCYIVYDSDGFNNWIGQCRYLYLDFDGIKKIKKSDIEHYINLIKL